MRLKSGYRLRELGDTFILVVDNPSGRTDTTDLLSFNETAAWLWKQASGNEFDEKWLAARLLEEYEIAPDLAASESGRIVTIWRENGLIEENIIAS